MKNFFLIALLFIGFNSFGQLKGNNPRVFNVEKFGAVHNGITDDRPAIQAAINAAYDAGGGVVFFPVDNTRANSYTTYLIHGALVTSGTSIGNPNSQLYIKYVNTFTSDTGSVSIKFLGELPPSNISSALVNYTINKSGVILYSDITGSGSFPSILGVDYGASGNAINLVNVTIENIDFRVKANIGATGPTMSAVNLSKAGFANINNVVCDIDTSSNLSVYPTAETVGIYMPLVNNGAFNAINNTLVTGYKYGYIFPEHSTGNNVNAQVCEHAFVFGDGGQHASAFLRMGSFWCRYSLTGRIGTLPLNGNKSKLTIDQLDLEVQPSTVGNWFDTRYVIYDSLLYLYGRVTYNFTQRGGTSPAIFFSKLGGDSLQCNGVKDPLWSMAGNQIGSANRFIGTTDSSVFWIKTKGLEAMRIDATNQNIAVGSTAPFTEKVNIAGALNISSGNAGSKAIIIPNGTVITGATGASNIYIDASTATTGTVNVRATTISLAGSTTSPSYTATNGGYNINNSNDAYKLSTNSFAGYSSDTSILGINNNAAMTRIGIRATNIKLSTAANPTTGYTYNPNSGFDFNNGLPITYPSLTTTARDAISPTGVLTGTITGGSGGTNGTYYNVSLTGGSGSGAVARITISGGAFTAIRITTPGTGYAVSDVLTVSVGGLSGATFTILTLTNLVGMQIYNTTTNINNTNNGTSWVSGAMWGYIAKTGTYTATTTDYTIDCTSGTFTVTLPTAVGISGRVYIVKNTGTGTITVGTTSSQTIDGSTTKTLSTQYSGYQVQSNGANWIIISTF